MKFFRGFVINLQFFTSLPIKIQLPMDEEHLESSIKSYPLLGLLQGAIYSLLLFVLMEWTPFSPLAVAFLVWFFMILLTGGIHLDGWMDASDAFFSYQDKEKRLEIMKDSRSGAFAVLSVIVLLGFRFLFIYEVTASMRPEYFLLILAIPFLSKSVMGFVLLKVRTAKKDGLASLFQRAAKPGSLRVYPVYTIILLIIFYLVDIHSILPFVILVAVAIGSYVFVRRKAILWFGGITGDVLGATIEGTEIILWLTLWLLHYFVMA